MAMIDAVLSTIDANLDASRERLFDLLRIPSISTQPEYKGECVKAAEWVRDQLAGMGFDASVRPTAGHPVRACEISRSVMVDLPAPGAPVMPTLYACAPR